MPDLRAVPEPKLYPCLRCGKPYSFVPPEQWHIDPAVCRSCREELKGFRNRQHVIFFVGPDMCGKTEIAKATSRALGVPYFKASSEHDTFLSSRISKREAFLNQLRYADPRVFDVLKQTGHSIIFDRGFPCEYAYSKVLDRETDMTMLRHMDEMWASIDARVIMCRRQDYTHVVDDLDPTIRGETLEKIEDAYFDFFDWSRCKHLVLNVDDEDLDREVREITSYLQGTY